MHGYPDTPEYNRMHQHTSGRPLGVRRADFEVFPIRIRSPISGSEALLRNMSVLLGAHEDWDPIGLPVLGRQLRGGVVQDRLDLF